MASPSPMLLRQSVWGAVALYARNLYKYFQDAFHLESGEKSDGPRRRGQTFMVVGMPSQRKTKNPLQVL